MTLWPLFNLYANVCSVKKKYQYSVCSSADQTLLNKSFSVCNVSGVNLFVMFLTRFQIFGTFVSLVFLGQAFTIMLVYIWSRRNPNVRMNFFGLLNFQAPFLPWVLMGFSLLLGNSIIVDLLGTHLLLLSSVTFVGFW